MNRSTTWSMVAGAAAAAGCDEALAEATGAGGGAGAATGAAAGVATVGAGLAAVDVVATGGALPASGLGGSLLGWPVAHAPSVNRFSIVPVHFLKRISVFLPPQQ